MKYRVTIRGQKADYKAEIECDEIRSWFGGHVVERYVSADAHFKKQRRRAKAVEHINLIERVEL